MKKFHLGIRATLFLQLQILHHRFRGLAVEPLQAIDHNHRHGGVQASMGGPREPDLLEDVNYLEVQRDYFSGDKELHPEVVVEKAV